MDASLGFSHRSTAALLLLAGFLAGILPGRAQGIRFESAGARFGFAGDSSGEGFHQDEGFVDWSLPWEWNLGRSWLLQSRFDLSVGRLGKSWQNAVEGSAGPVLALGRGKFPLWLEAGSSPTLISRNQFGEPGTTGSKNFGEAFQFTSHIGFYANLFSKVRVGYRFQHMSNAGLGSPNPGLNLQLFYVSCLF